jgi:hypothetical protein
VHFFGSSKLSAICIRSSIDDFPADCFAKCSHLSITQIEPDSAIELGEAETPNPGSPKDDPDAEPEQIEADQ